MAQSAAAVPLSVASSASEIGQTLPSEQLGERSSGKEVVDLW